MKSRGIRLMLLLIGSSLLIILIAILTIRPARYSQQVAELLATQFSSSELKLTFDQPHLSYASFSAKLARVFWPKLLFWLDFSEPVAGLSAACLLRLKVCPILKSNFYGGTISMLGRLEPNVLTGDLYMSNLQIEQHPQLAALQLSGLISADFRDFYLTTKGSRGTLFINLSGGRKAITHKWEPKDLPGKIEVPAFSDLNLNLKVKLTEKSAVIEEGNFDSSLGSGKLEGEVMLRDDLKITFIELTGKFHLRGEGKTTLGPWLPVISEGTLTDQSERFTLKIVGSPKAPKIKVSKDK